MACETRVDMRHSLQEIRYEHSFQVGHTATVMSAATAAAQPSAGNATEATAMSATVMVVQLMVLVMKLLLLLLLMMMLLQQLRGMRITRGVGCGISSRLGRDKRVDRQDGRETCLGPAWRRRSGRQSWCCGAHLEPVVLLVIL